MFNDCENKTIIRRRGPGLKFVSGTVFLTSGSDNLHLIDNLLPKPSSSHSIVDINGTKLPIQGRMTDSPLLRSSRQDY